MRNYRSIRRILATVTVAAATLALWVYPVHADEVPSLRSAALPDAERVVPLQGGVNFRDLGGYTTSDGRRVRRGLLYRSGSLAGLTTADYGVLQSLNIKVIVDLRSTDERLREPVRWPDGPRMPRRLERDYELQFADIIAVLREAPNVDAARVAFAPFYRRIPRQFSSQYRQMFDELLSGHAPLAFNCSAGKDRTGVAAALVLTALGVPRDTVMDDYLLSNRYYKPKPPSADSADDPTARLFSRLPSEVVQVFQRVAPEYLDAAFAAMTEDFGSVDNYLEQAIGLDAADRRRLRELYTERAER
ncbi:MAG: tyrosine-protein phosphatase [Sinobacteraceae bacterium]|nr:tyrosine-protein phosphatase [Nevskiaceae bacterium]